MKRLFDLALSVVLLIFLTPIIFFIAIMVKLLLGSPVLFFQKRAGRHGEPFNLFKFRTMSCARNPDGELLPDAERLNSFGYWLRATSLDELPGLWNVLHGDMSLVGPRPLHTYYLQRYSDFQARRHEVRPGITGWAQINGRNAISWDEKFVLDVWYVDNKSFLLDFKILLLTAWKIFQREGISAKDEATMKEFLGPSAASSSEVKDKSVPKAC
jgi:sugar transferase EpsL